MPTRKELNERIRQLEAQLNEVKAHQPQTGQAAEAPKGAEDEQSGAAGTDASGEAGHAEPGLSRQARPDGNQPNPAGTDKAREGEAVRGETGDGRGTTLNEARADQIANLSLIQSTGQNTGHNMVQRGGTVSPARAQVDHALRMETVTEVCRRIANGESLRTIAKDADMPTPGTLLRWCHDDAEFGQMYNVALKLRGALLAEEIIELSDEADKATEAHEVAAYKLRVNSRQWVASRLLPKLYGDHQIVEHTGEVKLDEKQIDARLAHLVKRIQGSAPGDT